MAELKTLISVEDLLEILKDCRATVAIPRERKRIGKPIEHVLVRTHVIDFDKFEEGLKKLLLPKDEK